MGCGELIELSAERTEREAEGKKGKWGERERRARKIDAGAAESVFRLVSQNQPSGGAQGGFKRRVFKGPR